MTLATGTSLGPYEIEKAIDAGGMGEVYLAKDTRLGRSVAVKVLPEGFTSDPRRRERFAREARALSSLTHPNICQIFDVGQSDGIDFLVMEYLEGDTLALRLMHGALPPSQVLTIGTEIASALESAHRQGIVHRDVKPSNIMLTRTGAKLLDFGLVKDEPRIESARTLSLTEEGSTPGTLQYMAPEQFNGTADARSDVWSLGTVLYEMATGRPPYEGSSRAALSAAILSRDPDLAAVGSDGLRHTVERCLARDPEDRWQSARDVADELRWIARESPRRRRRASIRTAALVLTALALLSAAGFMAWSWSRRTEHEIPLRLSIALPRGEKLRSTTYPVLAISPDGRSVVFRTIDDARYDRFGNEGSFWVRVLDQFESRNLSESGGHSPVFSPDGEWIAYVHGGKLKKMRAGGGPAYDIVAMTGSPRGLAWSPDGNLYFAKSHSGGISRVASDGSGLTELTVPDESAGENSHRWPHALPDGRHLLITIRTSRIESFDQATIALLSLETGRWRKLFDGGSHAHYVPTGHIVFIQDGSLMAIPFDLTTLSVRGSPVPLVHGVQYDSSTGTGQFSIAEAGTLIYASGPAWPKPTEFLRMDRAGAIIDTCTVQKGVDSFRTSPDSRTIAIHASAANDDIWTYDIERETLSRATSRPGDEVWPAWTPDGTTLIFGGQGGLYRQAADGSGEAQLVTPGLNSHPSCSPDCKLIAYSSYHPGSASDIRIVSTDGSEPPVPFVGTPANEYGPEFSPDGRWISYVSNESGLPEVYLRPITGGGRIQISSQGGLSPRWSRNGKELYFRFGDEFFAVPISLEDRPSAGTAELMFRITGIRGMDILGDDFLLQKSPDDRDIPSGINVVPDFFREITARVPRP